MASYWICELFHIPRSFQTVFFTYLHWAFSAAYLRICDYFRNDPHLRMIWVGLYIISESRRANRALAHQRAIHSVNATIREFCWRVGHFFDTCKNRAAFANDELRRMRARACVKTMASLVSFANVEVGWFGDTLQALEDIGSFEGIHNLSLAGRDEAFVVRWTCLSIMAIRSTLNSRRQPGYEDNVWHHLLYINLR
jgi:hypothetical protein